MSRFGFIIRLNLQMSYSKVMLFVFKITNLLLKTNPLFGAGLHNPARLPKTAK